MKPATVAGIRATVIAAAAQNPDLWGMSPVDLVLDNHAVQHSAEAVAYLCAANVDSYLTPRASARYRMGARPAGFPVFLRIVADAWCADFREAPDAAQTLALFLTTEIPTPWTAAAPYATVAAGIVARNPGAYALRSEDITR